MADDWSYAFDSDTLRDRFGGSFMASEPDANGNVAVLLSQADAHAIIAALSTAPDPAPVEAGGVREALVLAADRIDLLLRMFPQATISGDHPTATRYVLRKARTALSSSSAPLTPSGASVEVVARAAGWYPAIGKPGKITRSDKRCQDGVFVDSWEAACEHDGLTPAPTQGDGGDLAKAAAFVAKTAEDVHAAVGSAIRLCQIHASDCIDENLERQKLRLAVFNALEMPTINARQAAVTARRIADALATPSPSPASAPSPAGGAVRPVDHRALAVEIVDGIHGFTYEFSGSPTQHLDQYDTVEWLLNRALSSPATPEPDAPTGIVSSIRALAAGDPAHKLLLTEEQARAAKKNAEAWLAERGLTPEPALAGGVRVKALEWQEEFRDGSFVKLIALTPFGAYEASSEFTALTNKGPMTALPRWKGPLDNSSHEVVSLDEAKAAAQADYEARILSALPPAPAPDRKEGE